MSGEAIALNVVNRFDNKLKILYCENSFLTPALRRLLVIFNIAPFYMIVHDYTCSVWYPNLTIKSKHRIQTTQNKCMRLC